MTTRLADVNKSHSILVLLILTVVSCNNNDLMGSEALEQKHYKFHQEYIDFLKLQKEIIDDAFEITLNSLNDQESESVVLGQIEYLDMNIYKLECKTNVFCKNRTSQLGSRLSAIHAKLRVKSAKIQSNISNQYYLGVASELKKKHIEFNKTFESEMKNAQDYLKNFKDEYKIN